MLKGHAELRSKIIVQDSNSTSWNYFASELIIVDSTDAFFVLYNDSVVIENKNVVVWSILNIKQVFAFDPVSISVLPMARYAVLIWLCSLSLIKSDHDNCISVQRLKELIRVLNQWNLNIVHIELSDVIVLWVSWVFKVVDSLDLVLNLVYSCVA